MAPAELVSVDPESVVGHLQKLIEFYNPTFSSLELLEKSLQGRHVFSAPTSNYKNLQLFRQVRGRGNVVREHYCNS
jgi:hypothetical protein